MNAKYLQFLSAETFNMDSQGFYSVRKFFQSDRILKHFSVKLIAFYAC